MKKVRIIPIFIPHAGCKHECVFCNQRVISSKLTFSLETIEEDIALWLRRMNADETNPVELAFYGGSFTALDEGLQNHLLQIANKHKSISAIRVSTRPDCITPVIVKNLQQKGVRTIELGVQFLDDEMLVKAKRGHSVEDVRQAVKTIRKNAADISIGLQFLIGFMGETEKYMSDTVKEVLRIRPDLIRLYPLLVLKGTELADWLIKGKYQPLSLEDAIRKTAYFYERYVAADIKVIRVGLQASEELENRECVLAGPYHPSFGEMVQAEIFYNKINVVLEKIYSQASGLMDNVQIRCNNKDISKVKGNGKKNVKAWLEKYRLKNMAISACDKIDIWTVEIQSGKIIEKIKIL